MLSGLTLFDKVEVTRYSAPIAAGATDVTNLPSISCANRDLYCFIVGFGTIVTGAVTSLEVHGSTDGTNFSLLKTDTGANCSVAIADSQDNKFTLIEVVKPLGTIKNLRLVIKRATQDATVEGVTLITGNSRKMPSTQPASVIGLTRFIGVATA